MLHVLAGYRRFMVSIYAKRLKSAGVSSVGVVGIGVRACVRACRVRFSEEAQMIEVREGEGIAR